MRKVKVVQKGQPGRSIVRAAYANVSHPLTAATIQPPIATNWGAVAAARALPLGGDVPGVQIDQGMQADVPRASQVVRSAFDQAHSRPIAVYGESLQNALRGAGRW